MLLTRIEKIGDSAVLLLTDEMLKLLDIGGLIIRSRNEGILTRDVPRHRKIA